MAQWGDIIVPSEPTYDADYDMEAEEGRHLRFVPSDGRWQLAIRQPLVGYRYRIRWPCPDTPVEAPIAGET